MFRICIPSHNRPKTICEKTLKFLNKTCEYKTTVWVFTPLDQAIDYDEEIKKHNFKNLNIEFAYSPYTLSEKMNMIINDYFKHDDFVIYLEDDLECIQSLVEFQNKKHLTEITDMTKFIQKTYDILIDNDLKVFGCYPCYNAYFMNFNNTTDFRFLINHFWGCIVNKDKPIIINTDFKCDYEKSILFYKEYSKMLRYNHIVCKTKNYDKNIGGFDYHNRYKLEKDAVEFLMISYPEYVDIKNCKSHFIEIRLKKI